MGSIAANFGRMPDDPDPAPAPPANTSAEPLPKIEAAESGSEETHDYDRAEGEDRYTDPEHMRRLAAIRTELFKRSRST